MMFSEEGFFVSIINFTELGKDGEKWEAFARDFLSELTFIIETPPNRGADQGRDMLVVEKLSGTLNSYPMRWLVSCKHFAVGAKSVGESDEPNIRERMDSFATDGFLGFYSTLPSASLINRLETLKKERKIRDFQIFDGAMIENYCIRVGYSKLLMRYFPESYKRIAPLHKITREYLPLKCCSCECDLLPKLFAQQADNVGVVATVHKLDAKTGRNHIKEVYWACKGGCDRKLEQDAYRRHKCVTAWEDIGDLIIPVWYLRFMFATINRIREGIDVYEGDCWEKEAYFLTAIAQKVVREMTEAEFQRVELLLDFKQLML
jgi:hypothetical protein